MLYFKNIPIGAYFLNKEKRLLLKTSERYARQGSMPAYRYNGLDFAREEFRAISLTLTW